MQLMQKIRARKIKRFAKDLALVLNFKKAIDINYFDIGSRYKASLILLKKIISDFNKKYKHIHLRLIETYYELKLKLYVRQDQELFEIIYNKEELLDTSGSEFKNLAEYALKDSDTTIDLTKYKDQFGFNFMSFCSEKVGDGYLKNPSASKV